MCERTVSVHVVVETSEEPFAIDGIRISSLAPVEAVRIDGDKTIKLKSISRKSGFVETCQVFELVISFATGVGASYVASWLYDRVKGKGNKVTLEGIVMEDIKQDEIRRIIAVKVEAGAED